MENEMVICANNCIEGSSGFSSKSGGTCNMLIYSCRRNVKKYCQRQNVTSYYYFHFFIFFTFFIFFIFFISFSPSSSSSSSCGANKACGDQCILACKQLIIFVCSWLKMVLPYFPIFQLQQQQYILFKIISMAQAVLSISDQVKSFSLIAIIAFRSAEE